MNIIKLVLLASFVSFASAQTTPTLVPTGQRPTLGPRIHDHDEEEDHNRPPRDPVPPKTAMPAIGSTFAPSVPKKKIPNSTRKPKPKPTPKPVSDPPTPPPTRSPTLAPQPFICFSGASTVHILKRGVTTIKDLQLGDKVLNAEGKYDVVYGFGHYAPSKEAEFVQITVAGLQQPLEISNAHMLFVNGALYPASVVVTGDQVQLRNGEMAKVVKVTNVVRRGIYGPYTMSGTIVVNEIETSCYVEIPNSMGGTYTHIFKHICQSHHRLICRISPAYCLTETYNENGESTWKAISHALMRWSNQQNVWVWLPIFVARMLFFHLPIYAVELVLTSKLGFYLVIALVSIFAACKVKKSQKKVLA